MDGTSSGARVDGSGDLPSAGTMSEFDKLWAMDATSAKMNGIEFLSEEKFDFSDLLDASLDVESSPEVAPACTEQGTPKHPVDNDECKTTPISLGDVATSVEANGSSSPDEWVFPRLIKTTPTGTSPAPPPPSTLGPLDHKKLEKWVISKLFQDSASECPEASALEEILPGLVDKPIRNASVFSPPSLVGVASNDVEAVGNDGSTELQPITAATRCKEVDEVAASVNSSSNSSTRESDNSTSSFLSATSSSSGSSKSTTKDTNNSNNTTKTTTTTTTATKSLAAIKKRAPTATTSKTALPKPNPKSKLPGPSIKPTLLPSKRVPCGGGSREQLPRAAATAEQAGRSRVQPPVGSKRRPVAAVDKKQSSDGAAKLLRPVSKISATKRTTTGLAGGALKSKLVQPVKRRGGGGGGGVGKVGRGAENNSSNSRAATLASKKSSAAAAAVVNGSDDGDNSDRTSMQQVNNRTVTKEVGVGGRRGPPVVAGKRPALSASGIRDLTMTLAAATSNSTDSMEDTCDGGLSPSPPPSSSILVSAPSAKPLVQSTPKESILDVSAICEGRGKTVTKEVHGEGGGGGGMGCAVVVAAEITPISDGGAPKTSTDFTTTEMSAVIESANLNSTHSVDSAQVQEDVKSAESATAAPPATSIAATPKSRVGRRSLIPTPCVQRRDSNESGRVPKSPIEFDPSADHKPARSLFGKKAAAVLRQLDDIGISPQLEGAEPPPPPTVTTASASRRRGQENPSSSLPVSKKMLAKPKMRGSGLAVGGRAPKLREENAMAAMGKVGVVPSRRGPFRPLNGLASRQEDDKLLKGYSSYPIYNFDDDARISCAKVMHSPVDKENVPSTPHSKWSPIKQQQRGGLGDSCHRCTKRLNPRAQVS